MAESSSSATLEAPKSTSTAHSPVREIQRTNEPELDRSSILGQRAISAIGGGSPEAPPDRFSGALGQVSGSSQVGMLRGLQRSYGNSYVGRAIQRKCDCGGTCANCQEKKLQRKGEGILSAVPEGFEAGMQRSGSGNSLDMGTRSLMESRFGQDFSHVRLHTDDAAAEAARLVQAQAFTTGRDIYFGRNRYQPQTREGQKLLAHELTHTIQQGEAGSGLQTASVLSAPGDRYEQEADVIADAVMSDRPPQAISISGGGSGVQRLDWPEVPSFSDLAEAGEQIYQTGSGLVSQAGEVVEGIAGDIWDLANTLASVLGGVVTLSGGRLIISVPALPVCPTITVQFTLAEIAQDLTFLEGVIPIAEIVSIYGSVGLHVGFTPELSGQLGPCTLNGLRIVIDPLAASLSASGSITVATALGLGGEMRVGLGGEVGVLILWPDPPIPIHIPVAGIEAGLAGFGRGIVASSVTVGVNLSTSIGSFSFSASRDEDLGLAIDLGLAGYGELKLLGQNLCTLYWPFWEWHNDVTISSSLDVSLDVDTSGASAELELSEPEIDAIPFDDLPIDLEREIFSDDCPLCDAFYALGLMPSQNGGEWTGHPTPPLNGPLEIYPRDPGLSWGSQCRGACGPDCNTCEDIGDVIFCEDRGDGHHQFWIYEDAAVCPTHDGCRQHDAGYDWCAAGGETTIIGPCHRLPDFEAVCLHGVPNAVSWIFGGPPHDPVPMLFADRSTQLTGCAGTCPDGSTQLSPPTTYRLCLPDITLFDRQEFRDGTGASTGNIPLYSKPVEVPYLGIVVLNVFARGSINAAIDAGLGPAWLTSVCLNVDPISGIYSGTAELHLLAGLDGSITVTGILGASANWLCLLEVIRIEGGLEAIGRGSLETELIDRVTVSCQDGEIALDNSLLFRPCLGFSFDLDALLNIQLFRRFTVLSERWNLLQREWRDCWDINVGVDALPFSGASGLAAPSAMTSGGAIPALSPSSIDADSVLRWLFSTAADVQTLPALPADPAAEAGEQNPCPVNDYSCSNADLVNGELTEFKRWSDNYAGFEQELLPGIEEFEGCKVTEEDYREAEDNCWLSGAPPACRIRGIPEPAQWNVGEDNLWGLDFVGLGPGCIEYYQQNRSDLPCNVRIFQKMEIYRTDGSTHEYKRNILEVIVYRNKIASARDGEQEERDWP